MSKAVVTSLPAWLKSGSYLALAAFVCTSVMMLIHYSTQSRIEQNREAVLQQQLDAVLSPGYYDNDLRNDTVELTHARLGSTEPQTLWRAYKNNNPAAVVISAVAPNGYGGPITLLVGISIDGELTGVRVIVHRETPGLGDAIDTRKSDWISAFTGHSLTSLSEQEWKVKKDGGHFDHFTGATITPRTITAAVHSVLLFFKEHREIIFEQSS